MKALGPSSAFDLAPPEGVSALDAMPVLMEDDAYHGKGKGLGEAYREFLVAGCDNGRGTVLIRCEPEDEAHLREVLPDYVARALKE